MMPLEIFFVGCLGYGKHRYAPYLEKYLCLPICFDSPIAL
jgi:hypothetical protein